MFVTLFILTSAYVSVSFSSTVFYDVVNANVLFEDYIIKFDKQYANKQEKEVRFEIFKANLEVINRLNEGSYDAVYALSNFTDLTTEEFRALKGLYSHEGADFCKMLYDNDVPDVDAPESLDWRKLSAVTRVKDQSDHCGSCWAFSGIGHLEGQQAIKHKQLVELSEQQMVDCDTNSKGCAGGLALNVFNAAIRMGGVMLEKDYPYEAITNMCRANVSKAVVKVTDCHSYDLTSQDKVKQLLAKIGPISISVREDCFLHYSLGIINDKDCPSGDINHDVLLVGYGTDDNNKAYWIVKNSWGTDTGEGGYIRMQRSDNPNGACGMMNSFMSTAVIA